jgi:CRP-like cAMP-binding protein
MHTIGAEPPRLLAAIPPDELARLDRDFSQVQLNEGRLLTTAHDAPRRVYFPATAVVALSLAMHDGRTAGVGIVGHEGVIGLAAIGGATSQAGTEATVHVGGTAWTITSERLRAAVRTSDSLRLGLERYSLALARQLAHTVVCNRLHSLEQRAARWLLLIADRVDSQRFPLTQEAFADLLGVSRPAVSTVGAQFARAGAAEFRRGVVHVHDVGMLERASCECVVEDREVFRPASRQAVVAMHERAERSHPGAERSLGIMRPQIRRAR